MTQTTMRLSSLVLVLLLVVNDGWKCANAFTTPATTKTTIRKSSSLNSFFGNSKNLFQKVLPSPKVTVPVDFVIPEPKPLTVTRLDTVPDLLKRSIALGVRLGTGAFVLGWKIDTLFAPDNDGLYALPIGPFRIRDSSTVLQDAPRPVKPIVIYEYDASPYCQRVREMVNLLDLTVEYRPCPGARQSQFSQELLARTGRQTVPYLMDPNTGTEMFESTDIITYLLETYGPQDTSSYDVKALWPVTLEPFSIATSTIAAQVMDMPGSQRQPNARADNERMKPLVLYAYESSPFCRPVKAKLCSLALPHQYVSCSRGSRNRQVLYEKTNGIFQVPYLMDPNTGIEMFESNEICDYLESVYTVQ